MSKIKCPLTPFPLQIHYKSSLSPPFYYKLPPPLHPSPSHSKLSPFTLSLSLSSKLQPPQTTTTMFEEALSLLSIWASMNSWLTPAVLFLLLNLMIGTIAVTSGLSSSPKPPSHHPDNHHLHFHHHQQQPPQIQTQLTRNPSVLQRLKSLNFYAYIQTPQQFHSSPLPQQPPPTTAEQFPEIHTHFPPPPTSSPPPPPSPPPQPEETESDPEPEVDSDDGEGPTLDEVYRLFVQKENSPHYNRQNSDTKPAGGEIPAKLPTKIKKSASHKSAFDHFEAVPKTPKTPRKAAPLAVAEEEDAAVVRGGGRGGEEVDARADDFINKFRQQLKMQRHDSILRYKDMITRGSAK